MYILYKYYFAFSCKHIYFLLSLWRSLVLLRLIRPTVSWVHMRLLCIHQFASNRELLMHGNTRENSIFLIIKYVSFFSTFDPIQSRRWYDVACRARCPTTKRNDKGEEKSRIIISELTCRPTDACHRNDCNRAK